MKTLYIVRHAKASHDETRIKDWERPLTQTGVEQANKISKLLKEKKIHPDKIISSHALRALNTAMIFSVCLDYPLNEIEISYDIYERNKNHILDLIRIQDNTVTSLMIFGHNPVFTDLFNVLIEEKIENLPTSAVGCIQFDMEEWAKIHKKTGKCIFLETGE